MSPTHCAVCWADLRLADLENPNKRAGYRSMTAYRGYALPVQEGSDAVLTPGIP